jgi:hypothetical protein
MKQNKKSKFLKIVEALDALNEVIAPAPKVKYIDPESRDAKRGD